ncbi:MAG: helix-turn-helix domain-containing protein [Bacteroidota bacterium]|jgi:transcriptional regulator with XRE-family HTH domain
MSDESTLARQLREAIEGSDRTLHQLANESKVSYSQVYRFAKGERSLTLEAASALADVLGLALRPIRRAKK